MMVTWVQVAIRYAGLIHADPVANTTSLYAFSAEGRIEAVELLTIFHRTVVRPSRELPLRVHVVEVGNVPKFVVVS